MVIECIHKYLVYYDCSTVLLSEHVFELEYLQGNTGALCVLDCAWKYKRKWNKRPEAHIA